MKISSAMNSLFKKPSSLFPFICVFIFIWVLNTFIIPGQLHDWAVRSPAQDEVSRWFISFSGWFFHAPTLGYDLLVWGVIHILSSCIYLHITSTILDSQWGKWRTVFLFIIAQIIAWTVLVAVTPLLGWGFDMAGSSSYGISGMIGVILASCFLDKGFWNKWKSNIYFRCIPAWIIIGILRGSWLTSVIYVITMFLGIMFWIIVDRQNKSITAK